MKTLKSILLSAALFFIGLGAAQAQDFQTGYFLGGYQYGYRMNPAFQSEHGFVSLGLGQSGFSAQSSLGLSDFLFVKDGKTCLFLNNKVSSEEFLKGINKKENNFAVSANMNILAIGFWADRNFITFDVNLKSNESFTLPYDLFRFLKDGTTGGNTFNLAGTGVRSKNYIEIAGGWSRSWGTFITGGARLKALIGMAELAAYMSKLNMTMAKDQWQIDAEGALQVSSPMVSIALAQDGTYNFSQTNVSASNFGTAGFGLAVDLGVVVNPLPWVSASLAILDFGFMGWSRDIMGTAPGQYTYNPSKNSSVDIFNATGGNSNPMQEELDNLKKALESIYKFKPAKEGAKSEMLPFRMNIGAEVRLPYWDRLSLGLLYSFRAGEGFNWGEGRVSLNVTPLDWISASISTSFNQFFQSMGFGLNLHPGIINFFIGADVIPGKIIPLKNLSKSLSMMPDSFGIPSGDLNLNGYMGFSIAFGKRHVDYKKFYKSIR